MQDLYPFKFNVNTLEYDDVAEYLKSVASGKFIISTVETIDGLSIEEWRAAKIAAAEQDAIQSGDDHQVTEEAERAALIQTDSNERIHITVLGTPATCSRRLLNRIAIQGGVNNAGITREAWGASLQRGIKSYLVRFADKNDAIMFKLAMWKRPGEDAQP
ncbi:hypothetical protein [Sphingobium sp. KCTC 72723]|uniref:hypothetical protein n=1 Tax=Sphingobium sp. KCTC 72723 TaxID=2733867 RepID=UPI00165E6379|nr:hypothetical protein [Sphingobium sp. KCTC 72723]